MPRASKSLIGFVTAAVVAAGGVAVCRAWGGPPPPAAPSAPMGTAAAPPSPDGLPLADPHAGAVRVASSPLAWGGARSGSEPTLSDRVVGYRIAARLDPEAHTVEGREQLSWRNRSAREVRAVYLHLYLNAFENEGSTLMTEARLPGFEGGRSFKVRDGGWGHVELRKVEQQGAAVPWHFVHPDGGPEGDHTVVRLDLPQPVAAGAGTVLDIDFFDQLPRVLMRTGHFHSFHLVAQWFPKIGVLELAGERGATGPRWNVHEFHLFSEFYADYGSYDVTLDVPAGWTVGATGEETSAPVTEGGRTRHHYVQGDVHDFAWTADRRTAPPLLATWTGPGSPPVQVKVLFPPEYAASAAPVLKATLDALDWFSRTLGPYPYRTVTAVIPPYNAGAAGGMEYPTFFTTEGLLGADPGTLRGDLLEQVTIHEFGHGYFYGILGSNEFEEPMLDEGLNEYWDQRMLRERGRRVDLTTPALRWLGIAPSLSGFDAERLLAGLADPADGLGRNAWDRLSAGSYASVYSRTATAMLDLENRIGRDALERAFKVYYERWKFRHPGIADLRDVLAEVSGQPRAVDDSFALHVWAATRVDDSVVSLSSVEELPPWGSFAAAGRRTEVSESGRDEQVQAARKAWRLSHPGADAAQAERAGPFPWRTTVVVRRRGGAVPQTLVVSFADGSSETVSWDDSAPWQRFQWVRPARAVAAELDPAQRNRVDASRLDDSRRLEPDRAGARRLAADIGSLLQAFVALVATL